MVVFVNGQKGGVNMKRMSHKALKMLGAHLNGYELSDGNIYNYENALYDLKGLRRVDEKRCNSYLINNIIDKIKERHPDANHIWTTQIAYSAGISGNTGQLHKCEICTENGDVLETIFTYV